MSTTTIQFGALLDCLSRNLDANDQPGGRDEAICLRDEFIERLRLLADAIEEGGPMPSIEEVG